MWGYMFASKHVNRANIDHLESKVGAIRGNLLNQETGSQALRTEVCRLMLVVETLRRVMVARGLMTDDDFERILLEIDLEDGVQDGMLTQKKVPRMNCSNCGKVNRKRAHCYSCGQPLHVKEKVSTQRKVCPKCEQLNTPRAQRCLYCGTVLGAQAQGKKRRATNKEIEWKD